MCLPPTGPEPESTTTYAVSQNQHGDPNSNTPGRRQEDDVNLVATTYSIGSHAGSTGEATNRNHASGGPVGMGIVKEATPALRAGRTQVVASTSSPEGSPVRTFPSLESAPGSPEHDPACSMNSPESLTLFDLDGCWSRTYRDCSPRRMVGTSASYWERWPNSGTAWAGGCSTHGTSECPSGAVECSLSDILEATPHPRYRLSARAAAGILRRVGARGRALPEALEAALVSLSRRAEDSETSSTRRSS